MQTKSMEKRIEKLEEDLTPEQIAKLGISVLTKCWDNELSPEEIEKKFKLWNERYVEHKPYNERVKIAFELHQLETSHLAYEYFKKCVAHNELALMYILTLRCVYNTIRVLQRMQKTFKDDIPKERWESYLKEHPEDRAVIEGEDALNSLKKQGITEDMLITLQKELFDNYKGVVSDNELWSLIGYPKPKSEFLDDFLELEKAVE